jgi:hypothetical protein
MTKAIVLAAVFLTITGAFIFIALPMMKNPPFSVPLALIVAVGVGLMVTVEAASIFRAMKALLIKNISVVWMTRR